MKKSRSILLILLSAVFALCVFAFTACTPGEQGGGDTEVKITVAPTTLSLTVGGATGSLVATVENSEEKVTWSSNKTNIATVTADATDGNKAVVTPVAAGEAVITAKIGDKNATCRVTVNGGQQKPDDSGNQGGQGGQGDQQTVTIALDKTTVDLEVGGDTADVTATVTGTTTKVAWSIEDDAVATIAADATDGNKVTVTPVAAGTTTLKAKIGSVEKKCEIKVTAETVVVKKGDDEITKLYLKADGSATLTAESTKGAAVTGWTSSNTDVVTVTDGAVTAVAIGYAVVTAKVSDDVKAEIPVWVTPEDYTIVEGENNATMRNDQWIEWHWHAEWNGPAVVTMTSHEFANNAATLTYSATGSSDFGVQFFYNYSAFDDRTAHELTLTLCSQIALTAKVNGTAVELEANTPKTVTIEYVEGLNRINNQTASISIQIDVNGKADDNGHLSIPVVNTVSVSDVIIKDIPQTALTTPADFAVGADDNKVTLTAVTDEAELIGGYEVAVYNTDGDLVTVLDAVNETALNLDSVDTGNYTLKIRAYANADNAKEYGNSAWSDGVTFNWVNNSVPAIEYIGTNYGQSWIEADAARNNKWTLYSEIAITEGTSTNRQEFDTTIVVDFKDSGDFWAVQLFRNITVDDEGNALDKSKKYKLSFDVTATFKGDTESGEIQIFGVYETLAEGVKKPAEKDYTGVESIMLCIMFGKEGSSTKTTPGRYVIENIHLVEVTDTAA